MRELKRCNNNKLTIKDPMGGGDVTLYYRTPTTQERVSFQKSQTRRDGNRIISRIPEARLESGFLILTGIGEGEFGFDGAPISSTPGNPGYRDDWKKLVGETAGDLVMVLGQQIFEGEQQIPEGLLKVDDGGGELPAVPGMEAELLPAPKDGEGEKAPLTS